MTMTALSRAEVDRLLPFMNGGVEFIYRAVPVAGDAPAVKLVLTGVVQPRIGVLSLPERYKGLPRGVYRVEFDAGVDSKGRIVSEVADIKQWGDKAAAAPVRKITVEVLGVVPRSGFSKKSLKDYSTNLFFPLESIGCD